MIENYCFAMYIVALFRCTFVFAVDTSVPVAVCETRGVFVSRLPINQKQNGLYVTLRFDGRVGYHEAAAKGAGELGTDPKISWRIGSKEHNRNHF